MAASSKVLNEAMKLSPTERVRVAEKLLESADAEGYDDESDAAIQTAWADEIQKRSTDLAEGTTRGLTLDEARRIVASDSADDEH